MKEGICKFSLSNKTAVGRIYIEKRLGGNMRLNYNEKDFTSPPDHAAMCRMLDGFLQKYPFLSVTEIGESLCGRSIPLVTLGNPTAKKSVLYVGTHHAAEWITTMVLLRFIGDFCEAYKSGVRMYNVGMDYLFDKRRILIVPMLNPDGVELELHGVTEDFPLRERVLRMNGGSEDFTLWQANARGVDLNHNYNARFGEYKKVEAELGIEPGATKYSGEYPESEPEVVALCNLIRIDGTIRCILTLHAQGEEIYYGDDAAPAGARTMGRLISRMSGYRLMHTDGTASYGGLTDWYVREFGRPAFTIECGRGKNPLPAGDLFGIYAALREVLFSAPFLG